MALSYWSQQPGFRFQQKKKVSDWILLVCYLEQQETDEISFVFCTDKYLASLNHQFLQHRSLTDILTFDYSSPGKISAEIYVSIQRIKSNSKKYNVSFEEEFRRVMIHGVLHCCGHLDKTAKQKKDFRKLENHYLQLFTNL